MHDLHFVCGSYISDIKVNANQSAPKLRPVIGGTPITEQLARVKAGTLHRLFHNLN